MVVELYCAVFKASLSPPIVITRPSKIQIILARAISLKTRNTKQYDAQGKVGYQVQYCKVTPGTVIYDNVNAQVLREKHARIKGQKYSSKEAVARSPRGQKLGSHSEQCAEKKIHY